ncbi:TPT-domain-containing protein [Pseudovirgaria hyperparasitica]|uniref:TPT-domain-containing protein n=1 Tax=Pseudovirgaria hyperparasitica TaxID=470096 RepID=A0A6A6VZC7_9PEZI|nr:TPT-domain-containing protein [Pseudovirgaria hyperparasitica]KAF2755094.1 TPT-domain-containing protein [Pseudovirgaria hyperparasitica]
MAASSGTESFPAFSPIPPSNDDYNQGGTLSRSPSGSPHRNGKDRSSHDRWHPRREKHIQRDEGPGAGRQNRHARQKSLSEAFRNIRGRGGSVTQNAHEIADALKAPVSGKLVLLCAIWYMTSILSNTSSKAILNSFSKPITLTVIQFAFVSSWCVILSRMAKSYPRLKTMVPVLKSTIRPPSRDIILTTLPLTLFQIGGHILSSDAMARIPVSLVHTIKGLSPLFTVLAYRFVFDIRYSVWTYLSLVPLTLGVIMACSANFQAEFLGLLYAFGSAVLFVTQNIVSKKLFNEAAEAEKDGAPLKNRKPDKLNLLCYSSGLAFLITCPIWLWSEGFGIIGDFLHDASLDLTEKPGSLDHGRLALEYFFNGTFHFGQNLVAFVLLSMVSPVTYSVASLIKRVFVIVFAIVWFGNKMTRVQGLGIVLTFAGLYLYDRTKNAGKADKQARNLQLNTDALLPTTGNDFSRLTPIASSPESMSPDRYGASNGHMQEKRYDDEGRWSRDPSTGMGWLPPGTKQEETWASPRMGQGSVSVS